MHVSKDLMWQEILKIFRKFLELNKPNEQVAQTFTLTKSSKKNSKFSAISNIWTHTWNIK